MKLISHLNISFTAIIALSILNTNNAFAEVIPANLFTDNMVIQQQTDAAIWGQADVGEKVTVSASWGESASAITNDNGKWLVKLATPSVTTHSTNSYSLTFQGDSFPGKKLEVHNVAVGEVWLASGQSNMAFTIKKLKLTDQQRGEIELPLIRNYSVELNASSELATDTKGHWLSASKQTIADFSGTAFFFARHLHENLNVPIGIINSSWGGTPIESWLSKSAQQSHVVTQKKIVEMDKWNKNYTLEKAQTVYGKALTKWQKNRETAKQQNKKFKQRKPKLITPEARAHRYPGNLYAGMIHPVKPYSIKGAIWYQGEANSHSVEQATFYQTQLTQLITSWRNDWNNENMPFYVVQLANYRIAQVNPVETKQYWPVNRESMRKVVESVPNTGMAVAIDIGDANNIHPQNKMELGRRLALQTLANDYNKDVVPSGPLYRTYEIEGDSIILDFDYKGSGLAIKGSEQLQGFAIAGADGNYVWADANIITRRNGWKFWQEKQLVQVHSKLVNQPKSVKYGWADNPNKINLYNKDGLPASPFSTEKSL